MIRGARLAAAGLVAFSGCAREAAEGRPSIHRLQLEGVRQVPERELRKRLAIEPTSWFPFAPKRYLDPFSLESDRARVLAYYQAHGLFAAEVTLAEAIPRRDGKSVDVRIAVNEGPPTRLAEVTVDGLLGLSRPEELRRVVTAHLAPGARFDHELYLERKDALERRLMARGYAWAKVSGQVEIDRDARRATVRLTVVPGPAARFGHIHVRGTERVDPHLVALHAGIREGEPFRPAALEEARGRIYNLGTFSTVSVEYDHAEGRPEVAELLINVREGTFNDLRLGGGVGIEPLRTDVHAAALYTRQNFRGGLRTLKLRLQPGYAAVPAFWNVQRQGPAGVAEAQLLQPDFPFQLAQLKYVLGYDVNIDYAYQYHGPRTQLGVTRALWHNHVQLGLSYNFQLLLFFNTVPAILVDPSQAGRLFGYVDPYRLGYWQEDFAFDLRDHPLDAHRGFYAGLTVEEGGVYAGGAFAYEKLVPDVRAYAPLGSRVTLAGRAMFGQIFVQGTLGSPITRRFYLGGPASHRGFSYNRLSQQIDPRLPGVAAIPIGGDQMVLFQLELRVNLFRIAKEWLGLAAFADAGDVAAPSCSGGCPQFGRSHVDLADLHYAVGGGLRYHTPVGTVRFDLGARLNRLSPVEPDGTLNPDPGQRFAFHLSVGEAF